MKRPALIMLSMMLAAALFPATGAAAGVQDAEILPVSDRLAEEVADNPQGEAEEGKADVAADAEPEGGSSADGDGPVDDGVPHGDPEVQTEAPEVQTEAPEVREDALPGGEPSTVSSEASADAEGDAPTSADARNVPYLDADGMAQVCPTATEVSADSGEWTSGWYVVNGNVEFTAAPASVNGDVHLILADGCSLGLKFGMWVTRGNSLTIYAQSENRSTAGSLTAKGWRGAGIGGKFDSVNCGNVTINGGVITATADNSAAAIGGGKNGSCGNIVINGGFVTANAVGSDGSYVVGAAIGSSGRAEEGTVTITGGVVEANGSGSNAAAIGGGSYEPGRGKISTLTISGGHVIADGGVAGTRKGPGISGYRTFSTGTDGHAFIETSSITVAFWSGKSALVSVDGNVGVYGNQVLSGDLAIAGGKTLTPYSPGTLTIPAGVTLANEGAIRCSEGTTIVNNGAIVNNGSIANGGGMITGSGTLVGAKADARKPAAPTAKGATADSILLETVTDLGYGGVEYACALGGAAPANWQSDPLFEGLEPATEYTFYARYAGNAFYNGATSDGAAIATANYRVSYVDAGGTQLRTPADVNVVRLTPAMIDGADRDGTLAGGWYVVEEDMIIERRIAVSGDVHLILVNGVDLNCRDGIGVEAGNGLTVYGQTDDIDDAGVLRAKGAGSDAAIGGSAGHDAGDITFESGVVMARGVASPAIGGGSGASLGSLTVNGGFVQAMVQAERVCALGGAPGTTGGTIRIRGGIVEAYSKDAPALGATNTSGDVSISVSGGALRLAAPEADAAIGVRDSGSVDLAVTGGLIYGFGSARAMTNCAPVSLTGGTMVFAPSDDAGVMLDDGMRLCTVVPSTVYNATLPQGMSVPADTLVFESDPSAGHSPHVDLPPQGSASFISTAGEPVAITSALAHGSLRFRTNPDSAVFVPAGFTVKVGADEPFASPERGMWLSVDGTVLGGDAEGDGGPTGGGNDPGADDTAPSGDAEDDGGSTGAGNDSGADDAGAPSEDRGSAVGSSLGQTGDAAAEKIAVPAVLTALAAAVAFGSRRRAFPAKRGKHARA